MESISVHLVWSPSLVNLKIKVSGAVTSYLSKKVFDFVVQPWWRKMSVSCRGVGWSEWVFQELGGVLGLVLYCRRRQDLRCLWEPKRLPWESMGVQTKDSCLTPCMLRVLKSSVALWNAFEAVLSSKEKSCTAWKWYGFYIYLLIHLFIYSVFFKTFSECSLSCPGIQSICRRGSPP